MNILFVTCWYPTHFNPNFGIFVKEHAESVRKTGANIKVVHIWPVKSKKVWNVTIDQSTDENGIEVYQILIYSLFYKAVYHAWPVMYWLLKKIVREKVTEDFKPDVLHTHTIYPAGFLALRLSDDLKIPFFLTEHWTKLYWIFNHPLWKKRAEDVYRRAEKVFPVSRYLKKQIENYTSGEVNLQVVPNIVDSVFGYGKIQRDDSKIELLCVMNFFSKRPKHKLPELVAQAIGKMSSQRQERFRIRYIGPGQENSKIKRLIENLDLGAEIIFDGLRSKSYIAYKMKEADYLVHPTNRETFGVVVAEALTTGLPCIISNNETLKELVNSQNGYIVQKNVIKEWAHALALAEEGKLTFDRQKIAEKTGKKFSLVSVGNQYMESYKSILNEQRSG